jgi:hypothetical protein
LRTNDRIGKVHPFSRGKEVHREFFSMVEVAINCPLILDVRKKTNESNIDLDRTELAFLVGQIPNECNMLTRKVVMDLKGIKILNVQRSRIDGPDCCDGVASDTANQAIQEVVELENLVGSYRDVRHLGNQTCVGSFGRSTHARSN